MMNASESDSADYSPLDGKRPWLAQVPDTSYGQRFDVVLATLFPQFSRSRLQSWIKQGLVWLDGETPEAKQKVWGGEAIEISPQPAADEQAFQPEAMDIPIVYEDEHILVVNKPVGLVVHPGSGNWSGTLLNGLLHHCGALTEVPRAGIVHRLDKDTSGLMVVAKTLEAQTDLVRQLQARTVKRQYQALVWGHPAALGKGGLIDAPIGRHPTQRVKMAVVKQASQGREARTNYTVIESFTHCDLVECRLETGRTHQIRVHMTHLGHPLIGDTTYGRSNAPAGAHPALAAFPRQALHAWRLGLVHPATGLDMVWETPLAADFAELLDKLRGDGA